MSPAGPLRDDNPEHMTQAMIDLHLCPKCKTGHLFKREGYPGGWVTARTCNNEACGYRRENIL